MPDWMGWFRDVALIAGVAIFLWRGGVTLGKIETKVNKVCEDHSKLATEVQRIDQAVQRIDTKVEPLWKLVNDGLPKIFDYSHSPNLMQKLVDGTITQEELAKIEERLKTETDKTAVLMARWVIEIRKKENGWT
jgi:hypothetical protein